MFIYCDALDTRVIGDISASLLATLPNSHRHLVFVDVVTTRLTKIRYYPVAKRGFHTIRIDIRTVVGEAVGFEDGKVLLICIFEKL